MATSSAHALWKALGFVALACEEALDLLLRPSHFRIRGLHRTGIAI